MTRRELLAAGVGAGMVALTGGAVPVRRGIALEDQIRLANAQTVPLIDDYGRWSDTPGIWSEAKPILDEMQAEQDVALLGLSGARLTTVPTLYGSEAFINGQPVKHRACFRVDWQAWRLVEHSIVVEVSGAARIDALFQEDGRFLGHIVVASEIHSSGMASLSASLAILRELGYA